MNVHVGASFLASARQSCVWSALALALTGCTGNKLNPEDTRDRLVYQLASRSEKIDPKALESELFGLPRLDRSYDRLSQRCKLDGGEPHIRRDNVAIPGNGPTLTYRLPKQFSCVAADGLASPNSWVVDLSYVHTLQVRSGGGSIMDVWIQPTLSSGDQYVQQIEDAKARSEKRAGLEQDAALQLRRQDAEAQEAARQRDEERRARAPAFRASVKVGDRIRLINAGLETSGLIVEVKRPLVFVQFDSMTVMGESRRWIDITQIEPLR